MIRRRDVLHAGILTGVGLMAGGATDDAVWPSDPIDWSIIEAIQALSRQRISHTEYVAALTHRAAEFAAFNPFSYIDEASALSAAAVRDRNGLRATALHGLPFALKDTIDLQGWATSGGLALLNSQPAGRSNGIVEKLLKHGAAALGKTNLDELMTSATGFNPAFGNVANPHSRSLVAGGSSSGSAVAVAAGIVPFALATDTGGSSRIPAALCGCIGYRPSVGVLASDAILRMTTTSDVPGIMARHVGDVRVLLDLVAERPLWTRTGFRGRAPCVGVVGEWFSTVHPDMAEPYGAALKAMSTAGWTLKPVALPFADEARAVSWETLTSEVAPTISAYLADRRLPVTATDLFGSLSRKPVRELLANLAGTPVTPEARTSLQARRIALRRRFYELFATHALDAIVTPTTPLPACERAGDSKLRRGDRIYDDTLLGQFTGPLSSAGMTSMSIPAGRLADGLPIGLEISGLPGNDADVLAIAERLEAILPAPARPSMITPDHQPIRNAE